MDLSKLASYAVDYPKTGTPVEFTQLPTLPITEKPDFLSHEEGNMRSGTQFYQSKKVLGTLCCRVAIDQYAPAAHHGDLSPSDGGKIRSCLSSMKMNELELLPLESPPDDLMEEMKYLLESYSDQLLIIAQTHTLSKQPESRLSEGELVSGVIMANWIDHHKRARAVEAMNLQVSVLQAI